MPIAPTYCRCGRLVRSLSECPCAQRDAAARKARAEKNRPTAQQRGYDSKWAKASRTFLAANPRCTRILPSGKTCGKPSVLVHHIRAHRGDQKLFWDKKNWAPRCTECHSVADQQDERRGPRSREWQQRAHPFDIDRSRIPVTLVCGPPGAGKSTYVEQHAGPNDLIIDLDRIRAKLAGTAIHQANDSHTAAALDERNRLLRSLATDTVHEHAWFIVAAPEKDERDTWAKKLGTNSIVVLDVPLLTCISQINRDPRREGQRDRMCGFASEWWRRYRADGAGGRSELGPERSVTGARSAMPDT